MSGAMARIGPSDAQANADALARRDGPYMAENRASTRRAFDWRNREPRDLREAVRLARAAYSDEVPGKLAEDRSGATYYPDGSPLMAAAAERYIFEGSAGPFGRLLAQWQRGTAQERGRAAIVAHVTIGSQNAWQAAVDESVPGWCASMVAEDALRAFLRQMSSVRGLAAA